VVGGVLFAGPAVGAALLIFAVGATLAPRSRVLAAAVSAIPVVALFGAVVSVILKQRDHHFPHDAFWPSHFGTAHELVLFAVLAFALVVWSERREDVDVDVGDAATDPKSE
jgi:hypothetical protein